ncbi:hypothetical protein [Jiella marina]|uniref:hypothetical protein n=1 Tax=Jiella sp. LLJ827 TaxID=2917712 RepID=UPI0021019449|nr:hypothetical protein [Jiella sp. LLJ827]MCQ0987215.1 hypothetical protein [Jiella sp. LLJ827]
MAIEEKPEDDLIAFSPELVLAIAKHVLEAGREAEFLSQMPSESSRVWITPEMAKFTKTFLPGNDREKVRNFSLRTVDGNRCPC